MMMMMMAATGDGVMTGGAMARVVDGIAMPIGRHRRWVGGYTNVAWRKLVAGAVYPSVRPCRRCCRLRSSECEKMQGYDGCQVPGANSCRQGSMKASPPTFWQWFFSTVLSRLAVWSGCGAGGVGWW